MLSSLENPKIKQLLKLSLSKYRKKEELYIVEGEHLVQEAMLAGVLVEAFCIAEKEGYTSISEGVMRKVCNTDSVVSEIGLCRFSEKQERSNKILILDAIQDPGNMGTLMRSAVAFGFQTIFIGNGSVDIYNDKVLRASQGAIFKLNFIFGDIISFLKTVSDYTIYGTNVVGGLELSQVKKELKIAFILGNEGSGISQNIQDLKMTNIFIPMQQTESLNVAIAGSIIMYELGGENQ